MGYKRVLVSMKGYLGDAVMAQPAIDSLSRETAELYVLSAPVVGEVLAEYFEPSRRLDATKSRSLAATWRKARELREFQFDVAVLVNNSFRSALTCRLARIPRRVGHRKERRDFLLTDAVTFDGREFQADTVSRLLEPLGIQKPSGRPRLSAPASRTAAELLRGATIGFQPGARDPWKRIPFERALGVAKAVIGAGEKLVLIGGPDEKEATEPLARELGDGAIDLAGATTIPETLGCLAGLNACYGGDTGLMHLSVSMGTPTVQVFGSERAGKWGHRYPPHAVIECPGHDLNRLDETELSQAVLAAAALKSNVQA